MSATMQSSTPFLISFSGIDGAGKSTQIDNLCARLREAGLTVRLLTFWDDAATLKRVREGAGHKIFGGDKGVGSPDKPIHRRDKNVRSPAMTIVRLGLYFLDALSLSRLARRALRSGSDVIVFDRFLYDELANLDFGRTAVRLYVRALLALVPRPRLAFVLDADPIQAHTRKPEYPLDFLFENRNAYLRLSRLLGTMTVIPPLPLDQAKNAVALHALREIFSEQSPARTSAAASDDLDGQNARPLAS